MYRFRGRVDLSALPQHAEVNVTAPSSANRGRVSQPGLELDWDPAHTSVAIAGDAIVLASGRAYFDDDSELGAPGEQAHAWMSRYRAFGESAPQRAGGGFAVTVVDFARSRVLLWIDRFAIEAACYRADGATFAFADACDAVPGASFAIDPQSIYDYLYFHVIPTPGTVLRDVRRVEGAHVVVAERSGAHTRAYWTPRFVEDDRRDLAGKMRLFADVVRRSVAREAADPRTACFLSGGTDSSTIAGMLARIRGEPAHAYSIGFESEGYDEIEYARIAARHFGLAHHEYYVTPDDVADAIPKLAAAFDQPFGNSSAMPAYYCALRAREDGFTRMLAGDGGDELYGGNTRYATQKIFAPYQALPEALRRMIEPPAMHWPLFRAVPGFRQLGGYVRHSRMPMPDRMAAFNLLDRLGPATIFDPSFLDQVDVGAPAEMQRAVWKSATTGSLLNQMLAYDWKFTLADSDMPKVQGASRLAGIDVGYPFLSTDVADLSLRIPPDWKVRGLRLRWFFKRALRDFLPREILSKKKHGFGLPFGPWCLRHARLRELAEDSIDGIVRRGLVRAEFARELMSKRLPEAPGYYGEMVWILMMLEQWHRRFATAEQEPFST